VGSLLCAAAFFGAILGALYSAGSEDPGRDRNDRAGGPRCDPDLVGEEDGPITVVYRVVDGSLGAVCFGRDEPGVAEAWRLLEEVAGTELLEPLELFAGYDADGLPDTVAYAGPIGDSTTEFTVAVEVDEASADLNELGVTMMHELAHVISQRPDQFDMDVGSAECATFHNTYGCFADGSYLDRWVNEFWDAEALSALPADGQPDQDAGDERCSIDPAFPGAYAASHPEEDFAESFSAFVFDVDMPAAVQPRLRFFERFPELAMVRSRAQRLGRTDLPNNFDECG
jgi:hypothetical protein